MALMYIFAVTGVFGLIALAWTIYEGRKLDKETE